ncbi:hypothetical protein [Streptosporangium sp. 'caverna']|uniref:hypothetical protein n=1 Tax=Streptosporangium sp. 'caverna' TaxID=2202249 RepID=UPI0013A69F9D|nr:hypothetical protein [Streptosporangium sp. 'caverna']
MEHYTYDYTCTQVTTAGGRLLGTAGTKPLRVKLSIPKTTAIGQALQLNWTLTDSATSPSFVAPDDYAAGARISATGLVSVTGALNGTIESLGNKDQVALKQGDKLALPETLLGESGTFKEGEIKVTPGQLKIAFTPPKAKAEINDATEDETDHPPIPFHGELPIKYGDGWAYASGLDDPKSPAAEWANATRDRNLDAHYTSVGNTATANMEFVGTGVEYIAERYKDHGSVLVELFEGDKQTALDSGTVDASKVSEAAGAASADKRLAQQVLWKSKVLPYGKYRIKVTSQAGPNQYTQIDGFNVITDTLANPPAYFDTVCDAPANPEIATVKVEKASASPSPSPTTTSPTPTPSNTNTQPGGSTTTTSTPKPTLTVTATVTPTRPTPTAPQVIITPVGGAQTGEAPDEKSSGVGLLGLGTAMVLGSVFGGVALKRRRAAHVRGQD